MKENFYSIIFEMNLAAPCKRECTKRGCIAARFNGTTATRKAERERERDNERPFYEERRTRHAFILQEGPLLG